MIRIEILNGPEAGRVAEFGPGAHLVGRHATAALPLPGSTVSGRHAELIVAADGSVRFRDLGSTNGTWSGGLKVAEGEWFPGSELRLGDVRLRLLAEDEAAAGADAGGDEVHQRALAQALGSKRRGGPLVFLGLVVASAAFAAWFFLSGQDAPAPESGLVAAADAGASGPYQPTDLLGGAGEFDEEAAAAWQLGPGLGVGGGALRGAAEGAQRAVLVRRIEPSECGLRLTAEAASGRVWPLVEFGVDGAEQATGVWAGAALGDSPVELALPCEQVGWYRLVLLVEGGATLRALRAEEVSAAAVAERAEGSWTLVRDGGNLLLDQRGAGVLRATGSGGAWRIAGGGLDFETAPGAWLRLRETDDHLLLILSDGPPVAAHGGGEVAQATGLLLRGLSPLWARFDAPVRVIGGPDGLLFEDAPSFHLSWDLQVPFQESSRLARLIQQAERERDHATLLGAARELVNRWPLDEEQVATAESLRAGAVATGRAELAALEQAVAEAVFLEAEDEMLRVAGLAEALAARFPATEVGREAGRMAQDLRGQAAEVGAARTARQAAYRARLLAALREAYPVLAAWISEEDAG